MTKTEHERVEDEALANLQHHLSAAYDQADAMSQFTEIRRVSYADLFMIKRIAKALYEFLNGVDDD